MKNLMHALALTTILGSAASQAATYNLPKDAVALSPLKATLVSQRPLCPDGMTCFTDGTVVELSFALQGCVDELAPVHYHAEEAPGRKIKLYVSASNVHRGLSLRAFCAAMPIARTTVTLVNMFGEVEVIALDAESFRVNRD